MDHTHKSCCPRAVPQHSGCWRREGPWTSFQLSAGRMNSGSVVRILNEEERQWVQRLALQLFHNSSSQWKLSCYDSTRPRSSASRHGMYHQCYSVWVNPGTFILISPPRVMMTQGAAIKHAAPVAHACRYFLASASRASISSPDNELCNTDTTYCSNPRTTSCI